MNIEIGGPGRRRAVYKKLRLVSRGDDGPRVFPGDSDGDDDRGSRDDGDGGGDNDGDGVSLLNIKKAMVTERREHHSDANVQACENARARHATSQSCGSWSVECTQHR